MTDENEKDFGMVWSVAFLVLAILIGLGAVVFIDQQVLVDYKIECALQDFEQKFLDHRPQPKPQHPVAATVEEALPAGLIHSMVLR